LYTRELKPAPDFPVKNGKPEFGTYNGPFGHFDIRGMKRPFGNIPMPVVFSDVRILGAMRFLFCDGNNIGEIELFDAGYMAFMETTLWNRKTKHRIAYRRILFPGELKIPRNFANSVTACRHPGRFVRIHSRLQKKIVHADFDFIGSDSRPPCEGRLEMDLSLPGSADVSSLVPYGVKRRCMASYQLTGPLHGWISTGFDDHQIQEETGVGFLDVRKAYYSLRTKTSRLIGLGRLDGRIVSFQLGDRVSHDDSRYNDNILLVDGRVCPLPPVLITRPYGVGGEWVIQDTSSMVDLVFTPLSDSARRMSAFVVRTDYHTVYGTFDGVLLTGEGERLVLKGYPGIAKKILLRI
jgi:Protein of unknown function (DUF2804).